MIASVYQFCVFVKEVTSENLITRNCHKQAEYITESESYQILFVEAVSHQKFIAKKSEIPI